MHFLFNFIIILCQAQFLVLSRNYSTKIAREKLNEMKARKDV